MREVKIYNFPDVVEFLEGPGVRKWQFKSEGIKLINIRNLVNDKLDLSNTDKHLSIEEVESKYSHFLLKEGEFVMASSGVTWGKIAEVKAEHLPLCLNTSIIKLVPKKELLEKRYLWHFIKNSVFRRQIERLITGSAQPNFGPSHLKKIKIPLPPLSLQKQIADLLDTADALRRYTAEQLAALDELAQGVFLEMFGDGKKWKKIELGKLSEVQGGLQVSHRRSINPIEAPYLRVANVFRGYLNLSEIKTMRVKQSEFKRVLLKKNDILIVEGHGNKNEIGRSAIWNGKIENCLHQNHLIRIRLKQEKLNPCYADFFINSALGKQQIQQVSNTTSGLNTISTSNVKSFKIPFPPIKLQTHFATIIKNIEAQKEALRSSLRESEDLFNGLLQEVFSN